MQPLTIDGTRPNRLRPRCPMILHLSRHREASWYESLLSPTATKASSRIFSKMYDLLLLLYYYKLDESTWPELCHCFRLYNKLVDWILQLVLRYFEKFLIAGKSKLFKCWKSAKLLGMLNENTIVYDTRMRRKYPINW